MRMDRDGTARPALRLVESPIDEIGDASRAKGSFQTRVRRAVASENRLAAGLDAHDARWIFAVRVAHTLEGGRTGILSPERRAALVTQATRAGLREFDANLIIAIVQDSVRTGGRGLDPGVESRLSLIRPPDSSDRPGLRHLGGMLTATLISGAVLLTLLIRWVLGG